MTAIEKCVLCETDAPFERLHPDWQSPAVWPVLDQFVIVDPHLCPTCGLVFLDPMPDLELLGEYYAHQNRAVTETAAYQEQAEFINPTTGKFLDVGAYDGRLLQKLNEHANDAELWGIEPDKSVDPVIDYFPLNPGDISQSFNLITMAHVLEHLSDPMGALRDAHRLLGFDGVLFVEVPIFETPYIQAVSYFTPFHLYYFSILTLTEILAKAGFVTTNSETTGYGALRVRAIKANSEMSVKFLPDQSRSLFKKYMVKRSSEALRLTERLKELEGKRVAIFGTGYHTRSLLNLITNNPSSGFEIVRFLVSGWTGVPEFFEGIEVRAPEPENWQDIDAVICSSYDSQEEMVGIVGEDIAFRLYDDVRAYDTWEGEADG